MRDEEMIPGAIDDEVREVAEAQQFVAYHDHKRMFGVASNK